LPFLLSRFLKDLISTFLFLSNKEPLLFLSGVFFSISEFREADLFIRRNSSQLTGGGYQCNLCYKTVRNKGNLIQHMEVNHLPREPRYPCPLCGSLFATRRKLASHKSKECGVQYTAC
jgi:predicted RNA-binding Zn-ribbon protein involved in translation (DUF1610 family)